MDQIVEAKIRFLDYRIFKLNFEAVDEFQGSDEARQIDLGLALDVRGKADSDLDVLLLLGIKLNESEPAFQRAGFRCFLEIGGFFQLEPELNEQERANYLLLNGSSMLYSTARGVIAQLTAQTPTNKQVLPSINMAEFAKAYVERKAAAGKVKGRKGRS